MNGAHTTARGTGGAGRRLLACVAVVVLASALGHGRKLVPSLVEAQEQLSGARIVPR